MIPKFRAFIKANTETVYGGLGYADDCVLPVGLIDFTDREVTVWGCGREDCGLCGDDFRLDGIVLMQSTGLKDKNDVEIFEGDIVKIKQQDPIDKYIPNNSNNEIVYRDSAFCVKETREISDIGWPIVAGLYYKVSEEFEVIGNIYENPELVEVPEWK